MCRYCSSAVAVVAAVRTARPAAVRFTVWPCALYHLYWTGVTHPVRREDLYCTAVLAVGCVPGWGLVNTSLALLPGIKFSSGLIAAFHLLMTVMFSCLVVTAEPYNLI